MSRRAQIQVTRTTGPFESVTHTYAWDGPIDAPVLIGYENDRNSLPWPLHLIEDQPWMMGGIYIRTDVRWWRVTAARYALCQAWEWFTVRAVLTLHVWGLARYQLGARPSWKDVGRR